jgi:sugar phosphate isomerase/epimerase
MLRRSLFPLIAAMPFSMNEEVRAALAGRRLGMVIHSFSSRWRGRYSSVKFPPFRDVLDAMDYLRGVGVHSLQIGVDGWDMELASRARATSESYDMRLEGIVSLPQGQGDAERFTRELRMGKEAGMTLFRVAAGGRRYESFTSHADFEVWKATAQRSLEFAETLAAKVRVKLAVENHKDFETDELVELMRELSSPLIGVCLDTGNSLALLEDPLAVVQKLAPYALTVHLKDIAVRDAEDGFHMAEVPLGMGMLDLTEMIRTISSKAPRAEFHLEMITRDALLIPCLRDDYWATFPQKSGRDLVRTLAMVSARAAISPLPKVSDLSMEAMLALEERHVLGSFLVAGEKLGFSQLQMKAVQEHGEK